MILLDTCALIWLAADQKELSEKAKDAIAANSTGLFVSSISAFEIALKSKRKKLELPMPALEWFGRILEFHGLKEVPLDSRIAAEAAQLPPLHNDPCDRFIIATALLNKMRIVTSDSLIQQYQDIKVVW
jgi:PIN domain nuclease of toxin-antitoxin system